ncbi:MAG: VanZ family protein [Gallionella sp.]|nr:VanZ family protein [Gallionella sp.]
MKEIFVTETRARLRSWLALGYVLFIAYVSLSPFSGWQNQGLDFIEVLTSPLHLTYTTFDATLNLLSYVPLGLLIGLALRARMGVLASLGLSLIAGTLLSAGMEYLQMYLPARISSNMDLLANLLGTFLGGLLAVSISAWHGLFERLIRWRSRIFHHGGEMDFGLALLVLWMFGQINPSLPMLGNVFISEVARQPFAAPVAPPFDPWLSATVMLNLLMVGLLLLTLLRSTRHLVTTLLAVLCGVALAKFITAAFLLKSWALLLWLNSESMVGILVGTLLLAVMLRLPRTRMLGSGAVITLGYFVLVNFLLDTPLPAATASIYHWHYGHLFNYNGLAQTIALLFPLLLLGHLWRVKNV